MLPELVAEFTGRTDIAPKTRSFYAWPLTRLFLPWVAERGIERPEEITAEVVDAFGRHLETLLTPKGAPLAIASRRAYMKAVQQFLSWLQQRKAIEAAKPQHVQLPRLRRRHLEVLTRREIQALEDAAPTERNKLLIRVLADTGCRIGEAATLRIGDLVERDRAYFLRLRGKTGERLPPVAPALYRRLLAYARSGRPRGLGSDRLFIAGRRRHGDYEPLTEDGVYQAVKDAVVRSGIEKRVWPHLLRHSAITHLVATGMHPALVSDVTGVSVAVIAAHYSHPSDRQRFEAMMRALRELDES